MEQSTRITGISEGFEAQLHNWGNRMLAQITATAQHRGGGDQEVRATGSSLDGGSTEQMDVDQTRGVRRKMEAVCNLDEEEEEEEQEGKRQAAAEQHRGGGVECHSRGRRSEASGSRGRGRKPYFRGGGGGGDSRSPRELEDIPETQIDPQTRKEIKKEKAQASRAFDNLSLRLMETLQGRERDVRERLSDVSQCRFWSAAAPHPVEVPMPRFLRKRHREPPSSEVQGRSMRRAKTGREGPPKRSDGKVKHCLLDLENA